ncbi:hypothetical protein Scep_012436 [Stephania cephalantha]|uniref:Uncharacterized protein n=1 Tax=Stephania cephalantha TaxID=152367 RepID=A0AAP0P6P9_9MAGN
MPRYFSLHPSYNPQDINKERTSGCRLLLNFKLGGCLQPTISQFSILLGNQ